MVALQTGWTPDVIAELPVAFRDACRWALYAQVASGPEGLPSTDLPPGVRATPEFQQRRVEVNRLRSMLYPED